MRVEDGCNVVTEVAKEERRRFGLGESDMSPRGDGEVSGANPELASTAIVGSNTGLLRSIYARTYVCIEGNI